MYPLEDIKVLDLSRILAGPWCTMTLADLGATVWKVESIDTGDDTRSWMPPQKDGISTYYLSANRNKQSISVDLSQTEGREIILDLARKADILVENFRPESLKKLGLDYETLIEINPKLIFCSISGYGRDNEYASRPGYDFVLQAETGFMSITGDKAGDPMRLGVAFVDIATGMNATQAILAALIARSKTSKGQHIDIALHHSGLQFLGNVASGYLNTQKTPARFGNSHPSIVPYQLFKCKDAPITLAIGNDRQFKIFCENVINKPEISKDERFQKNKDRVINRDMLIPILSDEIYKFEASKFISLLEQTNVPGGRVYDVAEAFEANEAFARNVVSELPHDTLGSVKFVNSPLRFSDAETMKKNAPPQLGEHTETILQDVLGWDEAQINTAVKNKIVKKFS